MHVVYAASQLTCLTDVVNSNLGETDIKQGLYRKAACNAHKVPSSFHYIANTEKRAVLVADLSSGIWGRSIAALKEA